MDDISERIIEARKGTVRSLGLTLGLIIVRGGSRYRLLGLIIVRGGSRYRVNAAGARGQNLTSRRQGREKQVEGDQLLPLPPRSGAASYLTSSSLTSRNL